MVARKTCTVLLVDVSPTMRAHLPWVGDHLSRVVQNRLLYQRNDEFALVTCGARETKNDVHTEGLENAAATGEEDYEEEYLNVSVDVPMACASTETASAVSNLPDLAGDGAPADLLDALTVASDLLVRHERGGAFQRRVLFVTDLKTPCEVDDASFVDGVVAGMRAAGIQLTVATVGDEDPDASPESQGQSSAVDHSTAVSAARSSNRAMLLDICERLDAPGEEDGAPPRPVSTRSWVRDARSALALAQTKQTRATTSFRGDLRLTPWLSIKVWCYKKISEAKPPAMKLYNDAAGDDLGGDGPMVVRERAFTSYADPDNPTDVPPEMMISAYPYGPTNIPIQDDVKALISAKNDKDMAIFGFTPLDTVPMWYGMDEARVVVPWPSKATSAAAGMAASAGASDRDAKKAAVALSALAQAMARQGLAALTRAVWTQNSDRVSFGALTPHRVDEGDFLLFVPLPYAEDACSTDFKPLPLPGSDAAKALHPGAAAKLVPTQAQREAAARLVDALDGQGPTPWERLNPALTRTHALLAARAADELADPLAEPARGGPAAAEALTKPPLMGIAPAAGDERFGVVAERVADAAAAFASACGGLKLADDARWGRGWKRRAEELPDGEGVSRRGGGEEEGGGRAVERAGDPGVGPPPSKAARATPPETTAAPAAAAAAPRDDGEDAWEPVDVKEEAAEEARKDVMAADTVLVDDERSPREEPDAVSDPPPSAAAEDDGFFDDME